MNSMFNPIADANDNYLKEMAETGKVTPLGTIKRGLMGGLTTLGDNFICNYKHYKYFY